MEVPPNIKRQTIKQCLPCGDVISTWNSIKHIERELGFNYHSIWKAIRNKSDFEGFLWIKEL
jgi:hypothetical protein